VHDIQTQEMKEQSPGNNGGAIEIHVAENERGREYTEQLRIAAEHIQANGFSFETFEQIVEAIRFIETEIRRHCEAEEQYLFPLLDRHVKGSLQAAVEEHRAIWKALGVLRECVKDIEDLRIHPAIIRDLAQYSIAIADLLLRQIEKENATLFPAVKDLLTPEECDQVRASIHSTHPKDCLQ
jgi:hemerythrin-like domain-containing protein